MRAAAVVALAAALPAIFGVGGCATSRKLVYTPDELRAEVHRRAPELPASEIVVPFEISPQQAERARALVREAPNDDAKVRILVEALFDPKIFGLHYVPIASGSALETLVTAEGNCVSLASVFIGLARAAGLSAFYLDASTRIHERSFRDDEGMTVDTGHISAMVEMGDERTAVDFTRLGKIRWYRVIDDVEALGHLYNNRGYEVIVRAADMEAPAAWQEAMKDFHRATRVAPRFAAAWNNMGLAATRLGRYREAAAHYRTAIDCDPKLAAARNNLGSLYLRLDEPAAAVKELEAAVQLDRHAPHIQFNLATALLRTGERERARQAFQRAIDLRSGYPAAQAALDRLARQEEGESGAP